MFKLIATGCSNQEIADKLVIAVPALRGETGTHIVPDELVGAPTDVPVAGSAAAGA